MVSTLQFLSKINAADCHYHLDITRYTENERYNMHIKKKRIFISPKLVVRLGNRKTKYLSELQNSKTRLTMHNAIIQPTHTIMRFNKRPHTQRHV